MNFKFTKRKHELLDEIHTMRDTVSWYRDWQEASGYLWLQSLKSLEACWSSWKLTFVIMFLSAVWRGDLKDVHEGRPVWIAVIYHPPPPRLRNLETLCKSQPTTQTASATVERKREQIKTLTKQLAWKADHFSLRVVGGTHIVHEMFLTSSLLLFLGHQPFMSLHERARLQWRAPLPDHCKCHHHKG